MSFEPDKVRVVIDGRDFTRWTSYDIATNIFAPPGEFALEIGKVDKATLDLLQEGARVELYIDVSGTEQLYMTGRIEERTHNGGRGDHNVTIRGFDLAHDLMVSTAPFDLIVKNRQFIEVVAELVDPWQIPTSLSNEVSRYLMANKVNWKKLLRGITKNEYNSRILELQKQHASKSAFDAACRAAGLPIPPHVHRGIVDKKKDAKVNPGESVWDFIQRIANKAETFAWMSPDGWLTISRPQYEQDPLYILSHRPSRPRENNVESFSETRSIDGIPTTLTVHGRVREKGKKRRNYSIDAFSAVTLDAIEKYGLNRPIHMKDADSRTEDDFSRRAYYALKDAEKNYLTLSYTVAGHSQDGVVWAPDTVVKVQDEVLQHWDLFYITGTRFNRSRIKGAPGRQTTTLELTPLDVWVPQDA
jgi:prophage tail gpP-like protein